MSVEDFQLLTLSSAGVPLLVAAARWTVLERARRFLGLFLLFGLLNDLRHHVPSLLEARPYFIAGYVLCEMVFYVWFIRSSQPSTAGSRWWLGAFGILAFSWLFSYGEILSGASKSPSNGVFDVVGSMLIISLSANNLLKLTKDRSPLFSNGQFWFMLGILVYFMCSILIFSFISADFRDEIWFLHGVFDTIKHLLFAVGFWIPGRQAPRIG